MSRGFSGGQTSDKICKCRESRISVSDWSWREWNLLQPFRSTTYNPGQNVWDTLRFRWWKCNSSWKDRLFSRQKWQVTSVDFLRSFLPWWRGEMSAVFSSEHHIINLPITTPIMSSSVNTAVRRWKRADTSPSNIDKINLLVQENKYIIIRWRLRLQIAFRLDTNKNGTSQDFPR